MLSPLQEQVAEIIAGLEEAEGFALAGGAALIARGDVRRQTRDLDFFGPTTDVVERLVPAVDRALREAGLVVHHIQENPGFARLVVESGEDRTELDLGADARLFLFELDDTQYERLRGEAARWRERTKELARRHERARDLDEGRGPNLGREL